MKNKIQLVIPMSGQGTRYQKVGYKVPKPMIPVNQVPMIERLLAEFPLEWPVHFIIADNHKETGLIEMLKSLRPNCFIHTVEKHTQGPALALEKALPSLNKKDPVLVSYCDYGLVWDARQFERFVLSSECDACLVSYKGFHAHYLTPVTYAFSRLEGELVKEVKEKGSFTDDRENEYASCGAYYFKSAEILDKGLKLQRENNLSMNGEFYTSLTIQALLKHSPENAHVRVFEIDGFFQWGTPDDLNDFEYWEKTFTSFNKFKGSAKGSVDQVLIPMAGFGSRFAQITDVPKPLIPIVGQRMYQSAISSLPSSKNVTLVTRNDIANKLKNDLVGTYSVNPKVISIEKTPEGQALTTEIGLQELPEGSDVVISSCDHEIILNPLKWKAFRNEPQCDAAIFTVRGFPGTRRRPQAFSYVQTESQESTLVKEVGVKAPFTSNPSQEPLLVGTFWFKDKSIVLKGIQLVKSNNVRVNNELYLDSVFTELMKLGHKVRIIELDGYINWGDPDSLKEALYWYEIFLGRKIEKRPTFPGCHFKS